jgi:ERCC4-related helicase
LTEKKIEMIGGCLSALLAEKEIIARYELLQRVYEYVRRADLSATEREELKAILGNKHLASALFFNVLSGEPIFINLPKLDSVMKINDMIFHFVHTGSYTDPDFALAFKKYQDSAEELEGLVRLNLTDLLTEFMGRAGYALADGSSGKLTFEGPEDRRLDFRIFTSIQEVELVEGMDGSVVIVPHAESPGPFISFFQEKGKEAEEGQIKVWVANMEEGTIDPFIGYPKDMAIYRQFKNPRMAMMIKTNWGRRME